MGAAEDGYLQLIDADALMALMALASQEDLPLRLERRPGHRVTEALVGKMNAAFVLGNQRTATQDVEFSVNQLVEIAVRALSPGINDPFTAIACVDRLGSSLCRLARRDMPSPHRFDSHGRLRLAAPGSTFAGIVDLASNQIRQSGPFEPGCGDPYARCRRPDRRPRATRARRSLPPAPRRHGHQRGARSGAGSRRSARRRGWLHGGDAGAGRAVRLTLAAGLAVAGRFAIALAHKCRQGLGLTLSSVPARWVAAGASG